VTERDLEVLLAERIGLDAESIGRDELRRALSRRMEATGAADPAAYLAWAREDAAEWDELVEHVLVPETWWLREPAAFPVLVDHVRQVLATRPRARLLSMPCATGEEAYSMAMALLDAGIDGTRVEVLGADVSARSLAAARLGVYGKRSLRLVPEPLRARYLAPDPGGARVTEDLRRLVGFTRGNLLQAAMVAPPHSLDAIFCRNVLIYFAEPTRRHVVAGLSRLLAADGLLVTGHVESTRFVAPAFESLRLPGVLAYRRAVRGHARARPVGDGRARASGDPHGNGGAWADARRGHATPVEPPRGAGAPLAPLQARPGQGRRAGPPPTLADARALADAGHLDEARAACAVVLASRPGDADAHHLAGVIALAQHDAAAAEAAFRRAVYLAPSHEDALLHLALVCEARGARDEAARLRRRAALGRERGLTASGG
jgi:chemotaxis protein methyltransferase WspC